MNPDQIIYEGFEPEAILIRAVIAIVDAGVAFGGQNIGVAKHFVDDYFLPSVEVGVVVFHKSDRVQRREPGQAHMVQISHVERAWIAAHCIEHEL